MKSDRWETGDDREPTCKFPFVSPTHGLDQTQVLEGPCMALQLPLWGHLRFFQAPEKTWPESPTILTCFPSSLSLLLFLISLPKEHFLNLILVHKSESCDQLLLNLKNFFPPCNSLIVLYSILLNGNYEQNHYLSRVILIQELDVSSKSLPY